MVDGCARACTCPLCMHEGRLVVVVVLTSPSSRNNQHPTDMQMVNITIRVLSKPDSTQLRWIFRTLGKDYDERVLPSIVNEVSKAVVVSGGERDNA